MPMARGRADAVLDRAAGTPKQRHAVRKLRGDLVRPLLDRVYTAVQKLADAAVVQWDETLLIRGDD